MKLLQTLTIEKRTILYQYIIIVVTILWLGIFGIFLVTFQSFYGFLAIIGFQLILYFQGEINTNTIRMEVRER